MYAVRIEHNGRTLCFHTDTREGAFLMHGALRAAHPLHDLSIWYGGTKLDEQRITPRTEQHADA